MSAILIQTKLPKGRIMKIRPFVLQFYIKYGTMYMLFF